LQFREVQRFGGAFRLPIQVEEAKQQTSKNRFSLVPCLAYYPTLRMAAICSPKRRDFSELEGITTQKTVFFVTSYVPTYQIAKKSRIYDIF
jgi:hypothetical protein